MGLPEDARIGEVELRVRDIDRSLEFYEQTLGFVRLTRNGGTATLSTDGRTPLVHLAADAAARPRPPRTAGLFHVAILVPNRAALGRSVLRIAERGWSLSGAADHWVSEAIYLDDPDGLGLEIYRDRPRDEWPREGNELLMATESLDLRGVVRDGGSAWTGLEPATVIGHVHLQVGDLASAEARYCGEVGFTPMLRRFRGALFVAAGGYHHHLGLNTWAGRGVPAAPAESVGLQSFTIDAAALSSRDVVDDATGVTVRLRGGR
jgi:catechol 2,3-dioxygenase